MESVAPSAEVAGADEHQPLGSVLLKSKMLSPEQLDDALRQQVGSGRRLGEILVERGWLFPHDLALALALQLGLDYVDIQHVSVDPRAAACLNPEIGRRCSALAVRLLPDGTVLVAVGDPTSERLAEVRNAISRPVSFAVTGPEDIEYAWSRLLQGFRP